MSLMEAAVVKAMAGEVVETDILIEGAGAATPTKHQGKGVTASYVSTGIYRFTFSDHQGTYLGCSEPGLSDTAPAGVAGFTAHVDQDSYTASGRALDVHVYNAAQALADLPATSFMYLCPRFKRQGA